MSEVSVFFFSSEGKTSDAVHICFTRSMEKMLIG